MSEPDPPALSVDELKPLVAAAGLSEAFSTISFKFIGRFSNEVWRLDLDNGVRLVAKSPLRPFRPQDPPDVERSFYRFVNYGARSEHTSIADLHLPIPRYVGELDGILILEFADLQHFSFASGVTAQHAQTAIDALADWHAAWWLSAPETDWLPGYADPELRARIQDSYDAAWRGHGQQLLEYAPEFEPLGNALVGRLADTLAAMAEPATLIHGDAHAENIPLTDKGVLLLDWQEPRIANPGYDLAVFTTMSYRRTERSRVERDLVDRHATRLASRGCLWSDPWNGYRLGVLRRAARIVEIAELEFSSLPWVFRRSALAAVTLDVGELI